MDAESAKNTSTAECERGLQLSAVAGSLAVLVPHPSPYTAAQCEADNKLMDALESEFKHPTCGPLCHPSAENLVQKKANKLLDFLLENFGVSTPTSSGKGGRVAVQVKSTMIEAFEVSTKRNAQGEGKIMVNMGKVVEWEVI
jgi:hypothetical protein